MTGVAAVSDAMGATDVQLHCSTQVARQATSRANFGKGMAVCVKAKGGLAQPNRNAMRLLGSGYKQPSE